MLGWSWGGIEAWGPLRASAKVGRKTAGLLGLLGRRRQTRAALVVACHDAAKQVAGPMSYRGRRWLRGAMVLRVLARAAAGLEFALQAGNLLFISRKDGEQQSDGRHWGARTLP